MAALRATDDAGGEAPASARSRAAGWLDARLDDLRRTTFSAAERQLRCRRFLAVVLAQRIKQLTRPSEIATENGVDAFMKRHRGPGSMTLRRWFDYEPLNAATISGAFTAVDMTVADMGLLLTATLVAADKPPYAAKERDFRLELRAQDTHHLDVMLDRFERVLNTADEAAFVRRLTDESVAALREATETTVLTRALEANRASAAWEAVGFYTTFVWGLYQAVLLLLHAPASTLGITVVPLCVMLFVLLISWWAERRPDADAQARVRRWADPARNARRWMATYRLMVPGLAGIIVATFLTMLVRR